MKSKITLIILLLIILTIGSFVGYQQYRIHKLKNQVVDLKVDAFRIDSLRQVDSTRYQKYVNDLNTQKDLRKIVSKIDKDLVKEFKKEKKQPINVTQIKVQPINKIDTTVVRSDSLIVGYYPDKEKPFITYQNRFINDSMRQGQWKFNEIGIDLVVSERKSGLFEADIIGPSFLKVNKLDVNVLPTKSIKTSQKRFSALFGGGINYNLIDSSKNISGAAGVRIQKTNVIIQIDTRGTIGASLLREL